jgi:hypothetical protein
MIELLIIGLFVAAALTYLFFRLRRGLKSGQGTGCGCGSGCCCEGPGVKPIEGVSPCPGATAGKCPMLERDQNG